MHDTHVTRLHTHYPAQAGKLTGRPPHLGET